MVMTVSTPAAVDVMVVTPVSTVWVSHGPPAGHVVVVRVVVATSVLVGATVVVGRGQ